MAEHSAVNRRVVGSSPTSPVAIFAEGVATFSLCVGHLVAKGASGMMSRPRETLSLTSGARPRSLAERRTTALQPTNRARRTRFDRSGAKSAPQPTNCQVCVRIVGLGAMPGWHSRGDEVAELRWSAPLLCRI